jgi:hypothetical protein
VASNGSAMNFGNNDHCNGNSNGANDFYGDSV